MSNTLIDMDKLAERVQEHLGKINLHHVSYIEVIKMLLDELDEVKSGKPDWMRK